MLILTRRQGEVIKIGPDVEVMVLDVKGQQVRLGIQAPRSVTVDSAEVHARKLAEVSDVDAQIARLMRAPQ
jgi:carbon storage regulator